MNKMLPADFPTLNGKAALRRIGIPVPFSGVRFKDSQEGRDRRNDRRNARARKSEWLNS